MALEQLASLGYRTIAALDGEQTLSVLRGAERIDLLFTDIIMSGRLSGYDLAGIARKSRPHLGILLTSGYAESGRKDVAMQFLRKPYRKQDLALALCAVLDRH
jgi:CheY-like chemotaxis protein